MPWPALRRMLERQPLEYRLERQSGSHLKLTAMGRPDLYLAFHDRATIPPGLVRKILVQDVGLEEGEALGLIQRSKGK